MFKFWQQHEVVDIRASSKNNCVRFIAPCEYSKNNSPKKTIFALYIKNLRFSTKFSFILPYATKSEYMYILTLIPPRYIILKRRIIWKILRLNLIKKLGE